MPQRRRPLDILSGGAGGDPQALADQAAPTGAVPPDVGGGAMPPPDAGGGDPNALAGLVGGGDQGTGMAVPTDGPDMGSQMAGGIVNPGDALLSQMGGGDLGGGAQPGLDAAGGMGGVTPEELQAEQLSQVMNDPNADPQQAAAVQAMLDMAARRKLAGV